MTRWFNSWFGGQPAPPPPAVEFPATYRPAGGDARLSQPAVFDPALHQYPRAVRAGEPRFADAGLAARWHRARRRAMEHVLRAATRSPWADQLVLRGSVTLRAWVGDAAREPHDLDFVHSPPPGQMDRAVEVLQDLTQRVADDPDAGGGVQLDAADNRTDDIWTYARVPGRRVVIPWQADGLPGGSVQVDVVSGELVFDPPVVTPMPMADGGTLAVRTASPQQSLAWKLLWLTTDIYPQGKDLYDATLLAEHLTAADMPLAWGLLAKTFLAADGSADQLLTAPLAGEAFEGEWPHFAAEYPEIATSAAALCRRLSTAIAPTIAGRPPASVPLEYAAGRAGRLGPD